VYSLFSFPISGCIVLPPSSTPNTYSTKSNNSTPPAIFLGTTPLTTHVVLRSRQRFPCLPSFCSTMNCSPSTLHKIQCRPKHPARILHKSTPKFSKTTDGIDIRYHAPASYKSNTCRPHPAPTNAIDQSYQ